MEDRDRETYLTSLGKLMSERTEKRTALTSYADSFTSHLFAALEKTLADARAHGIPGIGKTRRLVHPAGDGREALQIFIEDWSIIFVPLPGLARPNVVDEARIPPVQFKELCGRIGVFLTDDPDGYAFYDFIIFQDGSWFAWGYGWPKQQADIESTDFEALASELIYSYVKDIFVTWHTRDETTLSAAMNPKERAYGFGLPGEELQGV
ncbi:MAG: hypothetical protein JXJ20_01475 [Anaerolineae bacterium]|nr:hypothetical protein [Anaerolineae bacterium]